LTIGSGYETNRAMNKYEWSGINTGTLPSHCEKVAKYWVKLVCFDECASGKAAGQKFKAVRAFKAGLRFRGLPEEQIHQAYIDTLTMARLMKRAE
jgi:hypothetical protein